MRPFQIRIEDREVERAGDIAARVSRKTKLKLSKADVLRQAISLGLGKVEGLYK